MSCPASRPMSSTALWLTVAGMGVITYALRLSFIALLGRIHLSPLLTRALRFVPAAVLSALVAPAVIYSEGALEPLSFKVLAALVASLIAWRTRNILFTVLVGMGSLWLLRWLL